MKNILILSSQVPFSKGGAEVLVDQLIESFRKKGHRVDILSLPFILRDHEDLLSQIFQWRQLFLDKVSGHKVDLVVATKFPTYFAVHANKVVWLIHQHRQGYELLDTRFGDFSTSELDESIRIKLQAEDISAFKEARSVFAISKNVSDRLREFNGIESQVLEPAIPNYLELDTTLISKGNYLLYVGRLCSSKRLELMIRALPQIRPDISLKVVGLEDEVGYLEFLKSEIDKHHISHRVEFLGRVGEVDLKNLYSKCFAVFYAPYDEDFGFVSYESAMFGKPIVTTDDSGYVFDVVSKGDFGVFSKPDPICMAQQVNSLWQSGDKYLTLQENAFKLKNHNSWFTIVDKFLEFA